MDRETVGKMCTIEVQNQYGNLSGSSIRQAVIETHLEPITLDLVFQQNVESDVFYDKLMDRK